MNAYPHQQHAPRARRSTTVPVPGRACGANPPAVKSAAVITLRFFSSGSARACPDPSLFLYAGAQ